MARARSVGSIDTHSYAICADGVTAGEFASTNFTVALSTTLSAWLVSISYLWCMAFMNIVMVISSSFGIELHGVERETDSLLYNRIRLFSIREHGTYL